MSIAATAPASDDGAGVWIGFAALCVGMFMAILDVQIVATALPTIQTGLGIAPDAVSWVQTAYLMAEVVSIPLTGPLTSILGLRRLVVTAILAFTAASAGCSASGSLPVLLACRVMQGLAGGVLIPVVFSSVFLLFPPRRQPLATAIGGILAVLAPTLGPLVGGYITSEFSWHWLFLINLFPGATTALLAARLMPTARLDTAALRRLDWPSLVLLVLGLALLIKGLKTGPETGWSAPGAIGLLSISLVSGTLFVFRTWGSSRPIVSLALVRRPRFAVGCLLSFVFGAGLFGSVYLMPVFLGYVRGHGPMEIGRIMLVTGIAQLFAAPIVAWLDARTDPRWPTVFGFLLFGIGLGLGARQTIVTDFDGMVWPQLLRGVAIMFCLVPATRLAMADLPAEAIPNASGLFNLMRNLGGALGLALIDTVLYGHGPVLARNIEEGLRAGDPDAAARIGLAPAVLSARAGLPDPEALALLRKLIGRASLSEASNEAWAMLALATVVVTITILLTKPGIMKTP